MYVLKSDTTSTSYETYFLLEYKESKLPAFMVYVRHVKLNELLHLYFLVN